MARGGPRQGTPGKSYDNRTDLLGNYGQSKPGASPASGGAAAPAPAGAPAAQPPEAVHPDTILPLDAPTQRPNEPVTAGLPFGPGAGPPAPPNRDVLTMLKYLPLLSAAAKDPDTPQTVLNFVQYLQSQAVQ